MQGIFSENTKGKVMNIFDIIGPVMVGPSSSHTAGAVRIGQMVRALLDGQPSHADICLHGSFAETGKGHGTELALIAGLLDMDPDDMRIPHSRKYAEEAGMDVVIGREEIADAHPNTALLTVENEQGDKMKVQACSVGGGRIQINKIDGMNVNCSGEVPTLIIRNSDRPGMVAEVTAALAKHNINIAQMHLFRNKKGGDAVMVVETDQKIPAGEISALHDQEGILKVTYIDQEDE